ncbi:hypothetical protein KKE26_11010 [bacterium]|nr:hypothetical protein [bacterium]
MLIKDTFKKIETITEWSTGTRYTSCCYLCNKREVPTCLTEKGRLCVDCVASEFKKITANDNLTELTFPQINHILNSSGNVRLRLILLWKFEEIFKIISEENPADIDALIASLVRNLEYVGQHPLARVVRQAAIEACIKLGKEILPILLQACKPEPWEFHVNIILSCLSIAPEDERVQNLTQKAAYHSNPIVREYALKIIANHNFSWGEDVLKYLMNDNKKEVAALAAKIMSNLDMLNLKKATLSKGITENELAQIVEIIDKNYDLDTIKKIHHRYLQHIFKKNAIPQRKTELICAMALVFADKDLFQGLFSFLSEDVKKVLHILVWDGEKHNTKKLEKMFGIQIIEKDEYKKRTSFCDDYILFQAQIGYYYEENSYLYLPDGLRKIIKKYLPLPEDYELLPLDTIKKTDFIHEDNALIISQIDLFITYIKQGNLKLSKNHDKPMKSSVKTMAKYCHVKEFYDDKDLEYIKTQLIIDFLITASTEKIDDSINGLKQLFDDFFKYNDLKKYQLRNLLSHVKGDLTYTYYDNKQNEETVRLSFFNLLREMSDYRWYLAKNIINHCFYNDIYLDIVDRDGASRYLYYNKIHKYGGYAKTEISGIIYKDAILIPLIKSAMFLFSAFGLVDIAYNLPENSILQEKEHKYLSIFDGLQYVRLTKLGAYVLGLTQEYEMEKIEKQKANLTLDEERLLIHIEGEDVVKRLALEKVGEKISSVHYRVGYNSFLKECFCEKDIQQKIIFFKNYISSKPPQIWQDFLNGIMKKINPLTIEGDITVYNLTPDKELISILATDEILKKYILKAENYRVLIKTAHINKVKKRLGELGYFVDKMSPISEN